MGVLQIFSQFYENKPEGETLPQVGDIWWVPTPDINEVPRIFDIKRADPSEHSVTSFEIIDINSTHFKKRERLPIKLLSLNETEELIISKAKKRPSIVLAATRISNLDEIQDSTQKRTSKKLGSFTYLVAPMYSISSIKDPGTFGPEIVSRIRAMHYPHLFCLPDKTDNTRPESIVRLDRVFPTYLQKGCEFSGKKLSQEPLNILLSQFSYLLCDHVSEELKITKELAESCYPSE
jgi:hypothetical protein